MIKIKYFLAIDIGASSGRHLLGHIENNMFVLEEIYRFKNEIKKEEGNFCWDLKKIYNEIIIGLEKCKKLGRIPTTIGIDTWGVDFVLLDKNNCEIGKFVSYRDLRTEGQVEKLIENFGKENIYQKTGIQFQNFNSIYQLNSISINDLERAEDFLMIPDYLNYLLTDKKIKEYTNMSTTQLLNLKTDSCDKELLEYLKVDEKIFRNMKFPGTTVGELKKDIQNIIGYNAEVILTPSHDTASAFVANLIEDDESGVVLSSGTWSLLGIELDSPNTSEKALKYNFTNEGGMDKKYRFLKNIMGLWIIQEVLKNLNNKYSFMELVELAKKNLDFDSIINVNDKRFFNCENMVEEIRKYCRENNMKEPKEVGEIAICVYRSLAKSYKNTINEIEEILNKKIKKINIIGGGCNNLLLNDLIKEETNLDVVIGPIEATGLGNIICQMISSREIKNRKEARALIKNTINKGGKI